MFTEKSRHSLENDKSKHREKQTEGQPWRLLIAAILVFQVLHYGLENSVLSAFLLPAGDSGDTSEQRYPDPEEMKQILNSASVLDYIIE